MNDIDKRILKKLCAASSALEQAKEELMYDNKFLRDAMLSQRRLIHTLYVILSSHALGKGFENLQNAQELNRIQLVTSNDGARVFFYKIIGDHCENTYFYAVVCTYLTNIFIRFKSESDLVEIKNIGLYDVVMNFVSEELEKMINQAHGITEKRINMIKDLINSTNERIKDFTIFSENNLSKAQFDYKLPKEDIINFKTAGDVDVNESTKQSDNSSNIFLITSSVGAGIGVGANIGVGATLYNVGTASSETNILSSAIDKIVTLVNTMGGIGAGVINSVSTLADVERLQNEGRLLLTDVSDVLLRASTMPNNASFGTFNLSQVERIELFVQNTLVNRTEYLQQLNDSLDGYINDVISYAEKVKSKIASDLTMMELNRSHSLMLRSYLTKLHDVIIRMKEINYEQSVIHFFEQVNYKIVENKLNLSLDGLKGMMLEVFAGLNKT
ncbi:hypothetical protein AAH678_08270 [Sodalis endosymbiont of Spalangia cameroni]|uniref:hypothetical protein n=1 Tax=Sodalis praecaptivus TaxID=1239307 RepID=UPI0031F7EF96